MEMTMRLFIETAFLRDALHHVRSVTYFPKALRVLYFAMHFYRVEQTMRPRRCMSSSGEIAPRCRNRGSMGIEWPRARNAGNE